MEQQNNESYSYEFMKVCPMCSTVAARTDSYAVKHDVIADVKAYTGKAVAAEAFQKLYELSRNNREIDCCPITVSKSTYSGVSCKKWREKLRSENMNGELALERLRRLRMQFIKNLFKTVEFSALDNVVLGNPYAVVYADFGVDYHDFTVAYDDIDEGSALCYMGFIDADFDHEQFGREGFVSVATAVDDGVFYFIMKQHVCASRFMFYGCNSVGKTGFFVSDNAYTAEVDLDLRNELLKSFHKKDLAEAEALVYCRSGERHEYATSGEGEIAVIGCDTVPLKYDIDTLQGLTIASAIDVLENTLCTSEFVGDEYLLKILDVIGSLKLFLPIMMRDEKHEYVSLLIGLKDAIRASRNVRKPKAIYAWFVGSVFEPVYKQFYSIVLYFEKVVFSHYDQSTYEYMLYHILLVTRALKDKGVLLPQIELVHDLLHCGVRFLLQIQKRELGTIFSASVLSTFSAILRDLYSLVKEVICSGDNGNVTAEKFSKLSLEFLSTLSLLGSLADADLLALESFNGVTYAAISAKLYDNGGAVVPFLTYFVDVVVPIVSEKENKLTSLTLPSYCDKKNLLAGYCFLALFKEEYWNQILILNRFSPLLFSSSVIRMSKFVQDHWFTNTVAVVNIKGKHKHLVKPDESTYPYFKDRNYEIKRSNDFFISLLSRQVRV